MGIRGWLDYWREVVGRAAAIAWALARSKLTVGVSMAVLIPCFTAWFAWDLGLAYPLGVVLAAVVSAALLMLLLFFMGGLVAAPYLMKVEQDRIAGEQRVQAVRLAADLTAATTKLDDRAQRRVTRERLGEFLTEGEKLQRRATQESVPPTQDVQAWLNRIYVFLPEALDHSYLARFESTAGIPPMSRVKNGQIIPAGLEELIRMRCVRLKEFLAELSSKP